MQKNVGTWDRAIRIILGLVLAYFATTASGVLAIILYILAIILVLTGIFGTCLLYSLLKINTKKKTDLAPNAADAAIAAIKKRPPLRWVFLFVDLGGIEPPSAQCECAVLPLDHRPF